MKPVESDRLDAEERRELSSSDFGIPEERAFPMPDAAHVRAAEAYFRYASDDQKPELARNILEKAAEYGVRVFVYLFTYLPFQAVALVPVRDDTADDVLAGHHIGPSFGIKREPEVVP